MEGERGKAAVPGNGPAAAALEGVPEAAEPEAGPAASKWKA